MCDAWWQVSLNPWWACEGKIAFSVETPRVYVFVHYILSVYNMLVVDESVWKNTLLFRILSGIWRLGCEYEFQRHFSLSLSLLITIKEMQCLYMCVHICLCTWIYGKFSLSNMKKNNNGLCCIWNVPIFQKVDPSMLFLSLSQRRTPLMFRSCVRGVRRWEWSVILSVWALNWRVSVVRNASLPVDVPTSNATR